MVDYPFSGILRHFFEIVLIFVKNPFDVGQTLPCPNLVQSCTFHQ